jgi:hypothetical protein
MEIGAADTGELHLEDDLAVGRDGLVDLLERKRALAAPDERPHTARVRWVIGANCTSGALIVGARRLRARPSTGRRGGRGCRSRARAASHRGAVRLEGRAALLEAGRVEDDDIRPRTGEEPAPVRQTDPVCRRPAEPVHRLGRSRSRSARTMKRQNHPAHV